MVESYLISGTSSPIPDLPSSGYVMWCHVTSYDIITWFVQSRDVVNWSCVLVWCHQPITWPILFMPPATHPKWRKIQFIFFQVQVSHLPKVQGLWSLKYALKPLHYCPTHVSRPLLPEGVACSICASTLVILKKKVAGRRSVATENFIPEKP